MLQIPFEFELKVDATFDNFIHGANGLLLEQLSQITTQPEFVFFYGESGSGKTHLLQAIAHQALSFEGFNCAYIPLDADFLSFQMLDALADFDAVCLDNFEQILQKDEKAQWQEALFNLYNTLKEQNKSLIISANQAPANLCLSLADLKSRLSAMLIYAIKPLSDEEKLTFLMEKAGERGMQLNNDLARYLLAREQRDLSSLATVLERLDKASLQAKRKLTIPFIREALSD